MPSPQENLPVIGISDEELVSRATGGDEDAFESLYTRYSGYVARVVFRVFGRDDPEIEDLVQAAFIEASRRLGELREPARFKSWVTRMAVRKTVRRARRRERWVHVARLLTPLARAHGDRRQEAEVVELWDALRRVSVVDRVPWLLKNVDGETIADIAELTETSPSTVKRRIARCERAVSEVLSG